MVAGSWPPASLSIDGAIPIAMEQGIAEDLGVALNDSLLFNVQGIPMKTVVVAIRTVDWFQLRPNFFMLFPIGILEEAPQFTVMLARAPSVQVIATLQQTVRKAFANVSTVDLSMVLETLRGYFDKVAQALQVLSLFVAGTGLMILAGALVSSREERLKEAALLRTLGAPGRTIRLIHVIEYSLIGLFSGVLGLVLGGICSFVVTSYFFKIGFDPGWESAAIGLLLIVLINVATGLFLGRGLLNAPPLETLRNEI